jgi:hypothetical protein
VFGTDNGKRLWVVGDEGRILERAQRGIAPFIREAHLYSSLEIQLDPADGRVDKITVQGRSDYVAIHGWDWQSQSVCKTDNRSGLWRCAVSPSALDVKSGQSVHFLISVHREGGSDAYEFVTRYDPWALITAHPYRFSLAGTIFVLTVCPTVLLFARPLWNLRLYRLLKLSPIEKIDTPVIGDVLRLAAVLPWFVRHPRTLDAWARENRANLRQAWESEAGFATHSDGNLSTHVGAYVPLPIRIGDPFSGTLVSEPAASEIRKLIREPRSTLQLIGPGGAGKTTLARQIGEWAFDDGPQSGLCSHPLIPVWVDEELDPEKNPLTTAVKGKLTAALPNEDIEDILFYALLRKQRLLVFVDRISERSPATQRHIETIYRAARIGLLLLTSRTERVLDGVRTVNLYPQPLNSSTLLHFMTSLLSTLLAADGASRSFSTIQEQLDLGKRLAALICLRTDTGEEDTSLVPLPVRLFVEQAVRLIGEGKGLDELPVSLPEVYLRHLRLVNPQDPGVPHFLDNDRMLKIARALAKLALGKDFFPKEFSRQDALGALQAVGESASVTCDPMERLKLNGVLIGKEGGMSVRFRFALDPIAEFLAAIAYAEEFRLDSRKWEIALSDSAQAAAFQSALKLVRRAYGW